MAPLFSNKFRESDKITLSENKKLIINHQKCAEVFNNYFSSIINELHTPIDQNLLHDTPIFDYPIIAPVRKCKRHPSILKIRKKLKKKYDAFPFYHVDPNKLLKILQNTDSKNTTQQSHIPVSNVYNLKVLEYLATRNRCKYLVILVIEIFFNI